MQATGLKKYRASKGVISTGREVDGTHVIVRGIAGTLDRIYLNEGANKETGEAYSLLEIQLDTPDEGRVRFGTNLTQGVATLTFAQALLLANRGDYLLISASLGKASGKAAPTYVNISRYDTTNRVAVSLRTPPNYEDTRPLSEKIDELIGQLRNHSAWRELEHDEQATLDATAPTATAPTATAPTATASMDPFGSLRAALSAAPGWPPLDGPAKATYVSMVAKMTGAGLEGQAASLASRVKESPDKCPPKLAGFLVPKDGPKDGPKGNTEGDSEGDSEGDYDPFGDTE
ncbi:MAG: hypothetical protein C4320_00475 [Armatimonadota bacterium]